MLPDLEPFFDRVRALFPDTRGHGLSTRFERVADYTYARKDGGVVWGDLSSDPTAHAGGQGALTVLRAKCGDAEPCPRSS